MSLVARALAAAALVGCAAPEHYGPAESVSFTLENDSLVGSDNSYTSGVALTWVSKEVGSYGPDSFAEGLADVASFLPYVGDPGYETRVAITIAQEMYTPQDITDPTPRRGDQPYAGVLFLQPAFHASRGGVSHSWRLRLGVVGPASLADESQMLVHRLTNAEQPAGWDTQLPNEPVINIDYDVAQEVAGGDFDDGARWRLVPVGTLGAGTYFTGAGGALYGEVGWDLPDAGGLVSVRRGLRPFTAVGHGYRGDYSFSAFAGIGGFAVGHYLPLDGTVFRDSRSVESEPFVGFASVGAALRSGRLALSLLFTTLTDGFEDQPSESEFGTLTLSLSL